MRFVPAFALLALGVGLLAAPTVSRAQQPGLTPSTTASQSGYPDVRKEAADPSLFPDPDRVARDLVRPPSAQSANNPNIFGQNGRGKKGGLGRISTQALKQADADPLPVRVAYRRAKTLAMERDPSLGALLRQADLAGTDVERRRYLRVYYVRLFAEVRRIDPSPAMNAHLDSLKLPTEQRYDPKRRATADEDDLINGRLFGQRVLLH